MPVFWRESLKGPWPIVVYIDPYSFDEARRVMNDIFRHTISAPAFRLLVDRRHCAPPDTEFVRRIVGLVATHSDRLDGSQVALVVGRNDVAYGMARMAALTCDAQALPCRVEVFREWDEAERWLEAGTVSGGAVNA